MVVAVTSCAEPALSIHRIPGLVAAAAAAAVAVAVAAGDCTGEGEDNNRTSPVAPVSVNKQSRDDGEDEDRALRKEAPLQEAEEEAEVVAEKGDTKPIPPGP